MEQGNTIQVLTDTSLGDIRADMVQRIVSRTVPKDESPVLEVAAFNSSI